MFSSLSPAMLRQQTIAAASAGLALLLSGSGSDASQQPVSKSIRLRNGVEMPLVAAGTWQYNDTVAAEEVVAALKAGFQHIDTAWDYENQRGVGKGLLQSGVKREDVFVTTKVPGCGIYQNTSEKCYNFTMQALEDDLSQLGEAGFPIKQLDMVLIHFPPCLQATPYSVLVGTSSCEKKRTGCSNTDNCKMVVNQWRALEDFYKAKKTRAIGVSNYCRACFKCLVDAGGKDMIMPMVNQAQWHVGMGPDPQGFRSFAKEKNMLMMAWSPLGTGGHGSPAIFKGNLTTNIGKAHGKSAVQVALKWLVQHGAPVATKSSNPKHLAENIDLFDWSLTDEEMHQLDAADFAKDDQPSFTCDDKVDDVVFA